jgi:hypothetical protein
MVSEVSTHVGIAITIPESKESISDWLLPRLGKEGNIA